MKNILFIIKIIIGGYFGNENNFFTQYLCEHCGQLISYERRNIIDFFKQIVI